MRSISQTAKRIFYRNPKRSGLLVGSTALSVFLCGRCLLNGPAAAPASLVRQPSLAADLTKNPSTQPTSAVLDWLAQPNAPLRRNLFASQLKPSPAEIDKTRGTVELQTTIMENPPRALVNGHLVFEGDIVNGYTILKIQPRKIVVQENGPAQEINMP